MRKFISKVFFIVLLLFPVCIHAQPWGWGYNPHYSFDTDDALFPFALTIDTVHYPHNLWQVGKPNKHVFDSAFSLPNAIVTDTVSVYSPSDTSVFIFGFRCYTRKPSYWYSIAFINFWYQMDIDTGSRGILELSGDLGTTWNIVRPGGASDYPDTTTFTHSTAGWVNYSIDMHFYDYDTVLLRFTFIPDTDTTSYDGWMIDNINASYFTMNVAHVGNPVSIPVFPNPASETITLMLPKERGQIQICDISGRVMLSESYSGIRKQLNVKKLPPGFYIVRANGQAAGTFRKE